MMILLKRSKDLLYAPTNTALSSISKHFNLFGTLELEVKKIFLNPYS